MNSKDFGAVLLFETIYFDRPLVCSAKDSVKDGHAGSRHGLKLEKVGPTFSRFNCLQKSPKNLLWFSAHWWSLFDIFFTALQEHFVYGKPGGVTQQMFIRGGSAPRSNPLPFYTLFFTKKVPLSYKTTCRRFPPFTKPSWHTRSCETRQHRQHIQAPCQLFPLVATPDTAASPAHALTMGKHHTLSTTQEKQDKLNITLLVTKQT